MKKENKSQKIMDWIAEKEKGLFIKPKLKGIFEGDSMYLLHLRNEAKVDEERKFVGWYRMYRLFIEPSGEFILQVPKDISQEELKSLTV